MAEITLKYFETSDSISSSDYNSNVDAINNGTESIGSANCRDQGLDLWNFKDQSSIIDFVDDQTSVKKETFKWDPAETVRTAAMAYRSSFQLTVPEVVLGFESDDTFLGNTDETVAIFRCNFEYDLPLLETDESITDSDSFLRFTVRFFCKAETHGGATVSKWLPQLSRSVTYRGRQLAMKRGYGNIGISAVIKKEDLDPTIRHFLNLKFRPHFSIQQNEFPDEKVFFHDGSLSVWDGKPSDGKMSLTIENFISNLTLYKRAL